MICADLNVFRQILRRITSKNRSDPLRSQQQMKTNVQSYIQTQSAGIAYETLMTLQLLENMEENVQPTQLTTQQLC